MDIRAYPSIFLLQRNLRQAPGRKLAPVRFLTIAYIDVFRAIPLLVLLIPAVRVVPALYRWRMTSRIYRWYGALQKLERDALMPHADAQRREDLMRHLDQIERAVQRIDVPAAYGDLFYGLRGHIASVRESLKAGPVETG